MQRKLLLEELQRERVHEQEREAIAADANMEERLDGRFHEDRQAVRVDAAPSGLLRRRTTGRPRVGHLGCLVAQRVRPDAPLARSLARVLLCATQASERLELLMSANGLAPVSVPVPLVFLEEGAKVLGGAEAGVAQGGQPRPGRGTPESNAMVDLPPLLQSPSAPSLPPMARSSLRASPKMLTAAAQVKGPPHRVTFAEEVRSAHVRAGARSARA